MVIDNLSKRRNFSARDHVYETLKESIIKLELKPGQSVSEKEISELLTVNGRREGAKSERRKEEDEEEERRKDERRKEGRERRDGREIEKSYGAVR